MEFQLKGRAATVVTVAILALVGFRLVTLGETENPDLEEAVRAELAIRATSRVGAELDRLQDDEIDSEKVRELAGAADPEGIEVHSMSVSAPLLPGSGRREVVVKVDFTLPGAERRTEYWVFERPAPGSWHHLRETSAFSFWSNLL